MNALIFEEPGISGNNMEVSENADGFYIEVENPWAGSTDTGFGESGIFTMTREQMRQLIEWATPLVTAPAVRPPPPPE